MTVGKVGLRRGLLLRDLVLQRPGAGRKLGIRGLQQEGIEATTMLDRAQGGGSDAQAHAAAERFGRECHLDEIWQEPRLGLAVRMADQIANEDGLPGQFATARHC